MNATVSYTDNDTPDSIGPIDDLSNNTLLNFYLEHCDADFNNQYVSRDHDSGQFHIFLERQDVAQIRIS